MSGSIIAAIERHNRVRRSLARVRWCLVAAKSGRCDGDLADALWREADAISWAVAHTAG